MQSVKAYFDDLRGALGQPEGLTWNNLRRAYQGRAYHNLDHLKEMLTHLERNPTAPHHEVVFGLALLYHDIIYKPTRKDNEARSARAAIGVLKNSEACNEKAVTRCQELIMATKNHLPSAEDDGDEALLIDLDLAVLAREATAYDRYASAVRREFWMLPGFVFRRGRSEALCSFLDRERIYHTEYGEQNYEARARENLWRELRNLK